MQDTINKNREDIKRLPLWYVFLPPLIMLMAMIRWHRFGFSGVNRHWIATMFLMIISVVAAGGIAFLPVMIFFYSLPDGVLMVLAYLCIVVEGIVAREVDYRRLFKVMKKVR